MQMQNATLYRLSESDRLEARAQTRDNLLKGMGGEPQWQQYKRAVVQEFPGWLQLIVAGLATLALAAAFYISAMNLNTIGIDTVSKTHDKGVATAGIAVVLLAESAQVIFSLALAVIAKSRSSRGILFSGMAAATAIALTGNIQLASPDTAFDWLLAILPPMIVLGVAYILKEQILNTVRTRHANRLAFQDAQDKWDQTHQHPEEHPGWRVAYATALKEQLMKVNGRGRGRAEREQAMSQMGRSEWSTLVHQELTNDQWYIDPAFPAPSAGMVDVAASLKKSEALVVESGEPFLAHNPNGNSQNR